QPMNSEDHDLLYRLGVAPSFVRVIRPFVIGYRQHPAATSVRPEWSHRGVVHQLEQERGGRYPGGTARRSERRRMIMFGARNASWWMLQQGHPCYAWDLYRRSLLDNFRSRHLRYLLAFPIIALASQFGVRVRGARVRDTGVEQLNE